MATGLTERERELREQVKTLYEANLPLIEKVGRGEGLTAEERTAYDQRDQDLVKARDELKLVVRMRDTKSLEAETREEPDSRGARGDEKVETEVREMAAFSKWFIGGEAALTPEDRGLLVPQARGESLELANQFRGRFLVEQRTGPAGDTAPMQDSPLAVSITGGSAGGYMVPAAFWQNLQIAMKAFGGLYPHFRQVDTDTGAPMSWPTTNPTSLVAQLLTENTQVTPQDVSFGLGQLLSYTFVAGPFLASIQLLNDSAFSVDGFVRERISEAIGRAQAAYAWTGTGSSQPLGLSTALVAAGAVSGQSGGVLVEGAAIPVTTFGNVATPLTSESVAGAMSFQTVYNLIGAIDPAYRGVANAGPSVTPGNPAWYMNDATLQAERKVTDQMGRPLIQQSVNMGGNTLGETLGGYPVVIDNNAPSIAGNSSPTVAEASGPVFGSLHHAMVARNVRQVGVMRLNERYADYLAVAWLGYMRYDIRSNDMRAVVQASYHS
jgi:HK97 family phage major capsid protein